MRAWVLLLVAGTAFGDRSLKRWHQGTASFLYPASWYGAGRVYRAGDDVWGGFVWIGTCETCTIENQPKAQLAVVMLPLGETSVAARLQATLPDAKMTESDGWSCAQTPQVVVCGKRQKAGDLFATTEVSRDLALVAGKSATGFVPSALAQLPWPWGVDPTD